MVTTQESSSINDVFRSDGLLIVRERVRAITFAAYLYDVHGKFAGFVGETLSDVIVQLESCDMFVELRPTDYLRYFAWKSTL